MPLFNTLYNYLCLVKESYFCRMLLSETEMTGRYNEMLVEVSYYSAVYYVF